MSNKAQVIGVIASLLLSVSALAHYVPGVGLDVQFLASQHGYEHGVTSAGVAVPIVQSGTGVIFTDMRVSNNTDNMQGTHLGVGGRKTLSNAITIGLNGFYDVYSAKNTLKQFVIGLEVLSDNVQFRANLYSPRDNQFAYKGFEGELAIKVKKVSLAFKQYHFSNELDSEVDGNGIKVKYEIKKPSGLNFYLSAGYQYDNMIEHQFSTDLGIQFSLGSKEGAQALPRIERSMMPYAYTAEAHKSVAVGAGDDLHNVYRMLLRVVQLF